MTQPVIARLDLVPAIVTIAPPGDVSTQTLDGVRVILTADTVYIWQEDRRGGSPNLIFEERLADISGTPVRGYQVETDDGTVISFRRSTGCACGGRIRSFTPFPQGLVHGSFNIK